MPPEGADDIPVTGPGYSSGDLLSTVNPGMTCEATMTFYSSLLECTYCKPGIVRYKLSDNKLYKGIRMVELPVDIVLSGKEA